ncbi:LysR family transcriptional regulator [Paenibacillus doosanensis]|uniref:LysR family transcriptional regulator n=1 Tax=Paenibacillus doosanensis TaxID=1229154 RepID=UPI00217F4F8D|nr:LysR family transcriptional regulator [Paenibacillus doosanensis]MCS7461951.1 LysR family transcriptional regulator [Paenibacillus doosanensis]
MDIKTLRTFQRIAELGSFHRAAEEMNYAQSTVTMQMQKLESDVGAQLIERGKKLALTEAGRLFYEQSKSIVKQMEQLQSSIADLQLGEAGHLRLGVVEPCASYRLPAVLQRFVSGWPNIRVSVEIASSPQLCERVARGELDLALCSAPELGSELYYEPLYIERFVLLVPERHPLASKPSVTPAELREHRLLITSAGCPYRRKLDIALQEAGSAPPDTMEIGSMAALKYYVQSGLGIALIPHSALNPPPDGTAMLPLNGRMADISCGLACKAANYPLGLAGGRLYRFLSQELREPQLDEPI